MYTKSFLENFPDMGAVKTEFTFDAPQLPPQSLNCPPSGTNPRKRKIPQGQTLADGNDLVGVFTKLVKTPFYLIIH